MHTRLDLLLAGFRTTTLLVITGVACACATAAENETWIPLFNGKDLSGWTPKVRGYDLGENPGRTFRVENGAICVRYDAFEKFDNQFGHLFYQAPFSNYVVRLEYRFVGQQLPDGPGWALRNSGIMLHCQEPSTIRKEQEFPVSIEVQLLGGDGQTPRTTANLCTPGTHVVMNGKLHTPHCTNSKSETFHGEQWVTAEVEVHGSGRIVHRVNGKQVLEYEKPQYDPGDADAKKLMQETGSSLLSMGYISLQSESHPVDFRKVEMRQLD